MKLLSFLGVKKAPAAKAEIPASAAVAASQKKADARKLQKPPSLSLLRQLFAQDLQPEEAVADEKDLVLRQKRLMLLINTQAMVIGALACVMVFGAPIMRPVYSYHTVSPQQEGVDLVPLFNPNLTNRAVLSWAATSVTEIMTLGFGDFDRQLTVQRKRFTSSGWESFLKALVQQKVRDAFKERQLILTTVPSDVPVIVAQGEDEENGYQWIVEIPIIMTYATNNNVTRKSRAIVRLTIIRVPGRDNVGGIAIKRWDVS